MVYLFIILRCDCNLECMIDILMNEELLNRCETYWEGDGWLFDHEYE